MELLETIVSKLRADGNIFDIAIQKTTFDDYVKIYNYLMDSEYELTYYRDLEVEKLPDEFVTITDDVDASHTIQVDFGFGTFSWLLYNETIITFEVDSSDFEDTEDTEMVVSFMQELFNITQKSVGFYLEDGVKALGSITMPTE